MSKTPRPPADHPQTHAQRLEARAREDQRLRELRAQSESARLTPYEEGLSVLRARASQVYTVGATVFPSAEAYVAAGLGCSERTVERRAAMVEVFEEEEFLALTGDGVALTTLERLALVPEEVREALVALALQVKDDLAVNDALRAWRREEDKAEAARSPEGLVKLLTQAAQQSLMERLAQRERRQRERQAGTPEAAAAQERAELERQRQQQAALQQQLEVQRAALAEQQRQVQEQQAALHRERQRLERLAQQGQAVGMGEVGAVDEEETTEELRRLHRALAAAQERAAAAEAQLADVTAQARSAEVRLVEAAAQVAAAEAQATAAQAQAAAAQAQAAAAQAQAQQLRDSLSAQQAAFDKASQSDKVSQFDKASQSDKVSQSDKASAVPSSARGEPVEPPPANLRTDGGARATSSASSADALEHKAATLWEQEQRQARRDVELSERAAALDARAAELAEIGEGLRALGLKARSDDLQLRDERQTLLDIREELNQRDQILAALAVMSGGSSRRWSAPPRSLGGVLIYLADALDNAYMAAGYLLRENVETFGERLKPGEMGLALELNHQLQRAEGMINALGRKLIEDFHGVHPRLATQELEAFEQAKAQAKQSGAPILPGAAGAIGLPKQPRLQEGFAVPVKLLLGTSRSYVRERGLLGTTLDTGEGVLLALSRPQTILVTGQPGSGKTHLLLVIIEMLIQAIKHISTLETPALAVWFHLGLSSNDYPADLGPATGPNRGAESVAALHKLGAQPTGLPGRRVVFVPPGQSVEALQQRQREYPGAEIRVIRLAQADRFPGYLRVLLGLEDNPASYLRWLDQTAAELGDQASPEALTRAINDNKRLNQQTRASALGEVRRAAAWHVPEDRPQVSLWADLDGAHVIVDMRSDKLTSRDALGVVMTLLGSLSQRRGADKDFLPAVAVLDEFNKIVAHGDLSMVALSQMTEVRHRKTWTFVSGQLPDQFPPEMSNLSSGSICGQTEGAASYEALCAMRPTLRKISRETFAKLKKGEVVVCFRDASDEKYRGEPLLVKIRPACAQPGGQTRYNSTEAEGED